MRVNGGGSCVVGASCLVALIALLVPAGAISKVRMQGELDRSFGHQGRAFPRLGDAFAPSSYNEMARQRDGGIVLTGTTEALKGAYRDTRYRERVGFVQRRLSTGELDTGFGDNGTVLLAQKVGRPGGLALQADERIVVGVPQSSGPCSPSSTVMRLDSHGAADPGFGSEGGNSAVLPIAVERLAVDAEGRIVAAGRREVGPCHKGSADVGVGVIRLLPDGALDLGFSENGIAHVQGDRANELTIRDDGAINGLTIRGDGAIIVAVDRAMFSLDATGAPNQHFGSGGTVALDGTARALVGLSDDKVVVAGTSARSCCSSPGHFTISRHLADGSPDPSFGGGSIDLNVGAVDLPTALAAGPGGSLLLGGETAPTDDCPAGECAFAPVLARFTSSGALDRSFGTAGLARLDLPGRTLGPDYAHYIAALAVTGEGQIVAAGGSGDNAAATVSALRPEGLPDAAFGLGGSVADSRTLPSVSEAAGIALGPGGGVLTSAWSDASGRHSRAIFLASEPRGHTYREIGPGPGFAISGADPSHLRADRRGRQYVPVTPGRGRGSPYLARFDRQGGPDLTYGSGGKAALPAGLDIHSMIVRPDGQALVVGRIAGRFGMAAFRLNRSGWPVRRFGRNGLAVIGFGRKVKAMARAAAFDRRGRIVLFGDYSRHAGMARLLPNGRPDRSFAYRGRQPYMPGLANAGSAVAVTRKGAILIAAAPEAGFKPLPTTLIRFRPDGIRDRRFGHNGVVRVRAGAPLVGFFGGRRLLLVSANGAFGERGVAIRAFLPNGKIDRRFGRRGTAIAAPSQRPVFRPVGAVRQPSGRIVVAGTAGRIEEAGATVELLRFR